MLKTSDDLLTQKIILLMTGVPGTVTMRDEISQLIAEGNLGKISVYIDNFMVNTSPGNGGDLAKAVQYILNSGYGIDLTTQKIDQLIADSLRQGLDDSWLGLFSYMINGIGGSAGKILDNRATAAADFTNLINVRNVVVDISDPLIQNWINKVDSSDESLNAAKKTLSDLIDQLTRPPALVDSAPADESIGIALSQNIELVFDKVVKAGTGDIVISGSDGDIRVIPVADSSQVVISGKVVTINPTDDLHPNAGYSLQLPVGVFKDSVGRQFAGNSDLNFSTIDTLPPILTASVPLDNAIGVLPKQNISLTFSEKIKSGKGDIIISSDDGTDVRHIAITDSSQITIAGDTLIIDPTIDLLKDRVYSVQLAAGVVTDLAGNPYAGISDLNFNTIDNLPPLLIASAPLDNAIGVSPDQDISLTFSEKIKSGGEGGIIISSDDGSDVRHIAITDSSQVTIAGDTLIINPTTDLLKDKGYSVQLAAGVITDLAGNPYAGISGLNFNTIDTLSPILIASIPLDDAIEVLPEQSISLIFSEKIKSGEGDIIISSDDGSDVRHIAITDSSQVTIADDTLIINPTTDLLKDKGYSIKLTAGAITDLTGNPFAGITDATTLNFRTPSNTIPAHIFNLTTGIDVFTGTSEDDQFIAKIDSLFNLVTLQSWDNINGGAGNDTLIAELNLKGPETSPTIQNVENIQLMSFNPDGAELDLTNVTGMQRLRVNGSNPLLLSNVSSTQFDELDLSGSSNITVSVLDDSLSRIFDTLNIGTWNYNGTIALDSTGTNSFEALSFYAITDSSGKSSGSNVFLRGAALSRLESIFIHNNDTTNFTLSTDVLSNLKTIDASSSVGGNKLNFNNLSNNLMIAGGPGNDIIDSGNGNDALIGGAGDDRLTGNAGDDRLEGGDGSDDLRGDGRDAPGVNGQDILIGGRGKDFIVGSYFNGTTLTDDFLTDRIEFAVGDSLNLPWNGWSATTADHTNLGLGDILDLPFDIVSSTPSTNADYTVLSPVSSTGVTADSMSHDIANAISTADPNAFSQTGDTILFLLTGSSAIGSGSYLLLVQNSNANSIYDAAEDTVIATWFATGNELTLTGGNLVVTSIPIIS